MCGIVGYVGKKDCTKVLLDSLSKLEYRGYDSAGIAVFENDAIKTKKTKGRLADLEEKLKREGWLNGTCGIGHTRWATHGEPSDINSHPHGNANISIVHNGIIENYRTIKDFLLKKGYIFESQTDTETVAKLLDYYYEGDPMATIQKVLAEIEGSYALGIIFKDFPRRIYAVRKDSPLIVAVGEDEAFIASDVPAILKYTKNYYLLDENEIAVLDDGKVEFFDVHGIPVEKEMLVADFDMEAAEKGGYAHFMLKEIHEQPTAIKTTITPRIVDGMPNLEECGLTYDRLKGYNNIFVVACGTAMHAGLVGKYVLEKIGRIPVTVDMASEFRYRRPILDKNGLVIVVSQSGETADTLAALREAKNQGVKTLGIVNVVGSSIAREADSVFYTLAGPEISVATTKAYSAQLIAGYVLSIQFAKVLGQITDGQYADYIAELNTIPEKIEKIIEDKERLQWFASKQINAKDIFFIGRGIDYAISLEGSLKLKEISYIHSEAYAAGELKHGTISLIEDETLVIGLLTQDELYEKTISNMVECKSRGAYLMGVTTFGNYAIEDAVEFATYIPKIDNHFTASLAVVPLQLLAYYVSVAKGLDVDKPRNLAKSVTVE